MSTEKKSVISTLENVIEDFDSIKTGMEYVGLTVGTEPTSNYGELIKGLKESLDKVAQVETLVEENESLNIQVTEDNGYFNDIYEAIVEQGQTPDIDDRSTYAAAILAIEGGGSSSGSDVEITNLAYFFYKNAREPDDYWELVTNKITNMNNMLNSAVLTAGNTYLIDLRGCVTEDAINNLIYDLDLNTSGTVNIILKVGANNNSLKGIIFGSSTPSSTSKNINVSFDESSDTSNITSLRSAISYNCFNNIDLNKLSNAPLTTMYQTFMGAILLGTCDFNNLNTELVNTFYRCFYSFNSSYGIKSIDISNWSFDSATTVEEMFKLSGITSVLFSNIALKDMKKSCMFYNSKIETLHLNIEDTLEKSVSNDEIFSGCSALTTITSDSPWVLVGNYTNYLFYNCNKLTQIPEIHLVVLNSTKFSYGNCGKYGFKNDTSLEEINIYIEYENDGQDTYYNQSCEQMFYNCSKLKSIKGNLDLSYIKTFTNMFYNCSALQTIETNGSIANTTTSALTLDLSASAVFDIASYINSLAENNSGYTRTIKINATVYSALSEETIALAATKNYTLASA